MQVKFDKSVLTAADTSLITAMTQKGFEDFIESNINFINVFISETKIPDFKISAGPLDIVFTDIQIANAYFPHCDIQVHQATQSCDASMMGISFNIVF